MNFYRRHSFKVVFCLLVLGCIVFTKDSAAASQHHTQPSFGGAAGHIDPPDISTPPVVPCHCTVNVHCHNNDGSMEIIEQDTGEISCHSYSHGETVWPIRDDFEYIENLAEQTCRALGWDMSSFAGTDVYDGEAIAND